MHYCAVSCQHMKSRWQGEKVRVTLFTSAPKHGSSQPQMSLAENSRLKTRSCPPCPTPNNTGKTTTHHQAHITIAKLPLHQTHTPLSDSESFDTHIPHCSPRFGPPIARSSLGRDGRRFCFATAAEARRSSRLSLMPEVHVSARTCQRADRHDMSGRGN